MSNYFLKVMDVRAVYVDIRTNMDESFAGVFEKAVEVAEDIRVEPSKPRVAKRKTERSNNPSTTVEEHCRVNLAIPFIDHILENIDTNFDGLYLLFKSVLYMYCSFILYFNYFLDLRGRQLHFSV